MNPIRVASQLFFMGLLLGAELPTHAQSLPQTALTVIHHISSMEGAEPVGRLVQGPDGTLYGVLLAGGTFGHGSVFKIDSTGQFSTLFSFGSNAVPDNAATGIYPGASLVFGSDGNLYGTTTQAGPNAGGTVFRITLTGQLTTLVEFGGPPPVGSQPNAPLYLGSDGNFYGTTTAGGAGGAGTVFQMTPAGVVTTLHSFAIDGSEGSGLYGGLVVGADGALYGTTSVGGFSSVAGDGTVFRVASDGTFSVLHYFPYTATNWLEGLAIGPDGAFYGLTELGGGTGNAFRITADGTYASLHNFGCSCGTPDGSEPVGPLTLASDGNFYGVTSFGGNSNDGTVFSMTASGVVTPIHSFSVGEGGAPTGGLIEGADGRLYGMTSGLFTRDPTVYKLALLPPSPAQPKAVAADGAVSLTWTPTKSANTYNVYEGTSAGAEGSTPILSGLTSPSATATGLHDGTTYYFRIVAVNEAGSGLPSAEVSATPIAPAGSGGGGGSLGAADLTLLAGLGLYVRRARQNRGRAPT